MGPKGFSRATSDPHRHHDVAVLVVFAVGGAELAGGLRVLQFESHVARAHGFEEVERCTGR